MTENLEKLKEKLDKSNLEYKLIEDQDGESRFTEVSIPSGRDSIVTIFRNRDEDLEIILDSEFEEYKFLKNYEAIYSASKKTIECEIQTRISSRFLIRNLNRLINSEIEENEEIEFDEEEEITEIELPSPESFKIFIGVASKEFSVLSYGKNRRAIPLHRMSNRLLSFKIKNIDFSQHNEALDYLEKISNSVLFQIELLLEIPLTLSEQKESHYERRMRTFKRRKNIGFSEFKLTEPKYEYDKEPMALYWYAKSSESMPLFQFLAYYQTIEYFFPIYSSKFAKTKIQNYLKDPRFNPNRDKDISKILSLIQTSGGKSIGNERDQLKATLSECFDNDEIRTFFESDELRNTFYTENKGKNLSPNKIALKNKTADLIDEVAERIYNIRCRIVHKKADEENIDFILPNSYEIRKLSFDIELIEFLSRKIIISSSRPFRLK